MADLLTCVTALKLFVTVFSAAEEAILAHNVALLFFSTIAQRFDGNQTGWTISYMAIHSALVTTGSHLRAGFVTNRQWLVASDGRIELSGATSTEHWLHTHPLTRLAEAQVA
jgi:hypothetical protein